MSRVTAHTAEVLMPNANARLTVHGRLLLVQRVREQGWAVAHAAKAMGISRQPAAQLSAPHPCAGRGADTCLSA